MDKLYAPVRIIFADDHEVCRDGFTVMMKKQTDIEIIDEARNGEQLIQLTRQLKPDIVITDIIMPIKNGIEATREIIEEFPHIGVIAFSMSEEETLIVDIIKAGAKGYILKSSGKEEVIAAVKAVNKGQDYYCRETSRILSNIRGREVHYKTKLTEKEIDIIKMICEELSNEEMAMLLGLSKRTIESYREKIMEKINARNIAGIVLYAIKNKIYEYKR